MTPLIVLTGIAVALPPIGPALPVAAPPTRAAWLPGRPPSDSTIVARFIAADAGMEGVAQSAFVQGRRSALRLDGALPVVVLVSRLSLVRLPAGRATMPGDEGTLWHATAAITPWSPALDAVSVGLDAARARTGPDAARRTTSSWTDAHLSWRDAGFGVDLGGYRLAAGRRFDPRPVVQASGSGVRGTLSWSPPAGPRAWTVEADLRDTVLDAGARRTGIGDDLRARLTLSRRF